MTGFQRGTNVEYLKRYGDDESARAGIKGVKGYLQQVKVVVAA